MKRTENHSVTVATLLSRRRNHRTDVGENSRRVEVELTCEAPQAERVFVAGDFNH
jgi:hypothetical protein